MLSDGGVVKVEHLRAQCCLKCRRFRALITMALTGFALYNAADESCDFSVGNLIYLGSHD